MTKSVTLPRITAVFFLRARNEINWHISLLPTAPRLPQPFMWDMQGGEGSSRLWRNLINTNFWKNSAGLRYYDTDDFFKAVLDKSKLIEKTNRVLFYSLDYTGLY